MADRDWRHALDALIDSGAKPDPVETTPLALLFEVRESVRRGSARWQHVGKTTTPAGPDSIGQLVLTVRPAMRGASARWVGGSLTWTTLQHQIHQLGLDRRQVRWFSELAALARAGTAGYLGQDPVRIALDEMPSTLLWSLLSEAREIGIELVGTGPGEASVRVGDSASLRLEASVDRGDDTGVRDDHAIAGRGSADVDAASETEVPLSPPIAEAGAVRLAPVVEIDGRDVTDAALGLIGDHGLYAITWPGPVVRLAPSAQPLTREALRLVGEGELVVPAAARDELEREVLPRLAASVPIESSDGTLRPPVPIGPPPVEPVEGLDEELEDPLDYPDLEDLPELTLVAAPSDQNDWLELGFLVRIGDRQVSFAKLFAALSRGDRRLRMVDKSYLRLDQPVFERLRILIEEAGGLNEWQTGVRVHRNQADLLADFEDLSDQAEGVDEWRAAARALLDSVERAAAAADIDAAGGSADAPLIAPPTGLAAHLRPYQQRGYEWLCTLYDHGLGGILADDMGLGKTVQALALVQRAVEARAASEATAPPFLVVAPSSVTANWVAEAARFTPGLRVASVTRTAQSRKTELADEIAGAELVVTSYAVFRLDADDFAAREWAGLLLDEAQFVKNHRSRAHECAKALPAPFKLAITGTPLENEVLELWSILDIVAPGLFPSVRRFTEQYARPLTHVTPDEAVRRGISATDASRVLARLRRRIRPVVLRRTKQLVAPELPEKQEQLIRVELSPKHRRLYDQVLQRERQKLLGLVAEDFDRQRFIVFRSLTLLRMLALDPALIDEAHEHVGSAKLDALLEQLTELAGEGHRALVFSQFTSFLRRAAARLDSAGIAHAYLDGSTDDRARVIHDWKTGSDPVFLISLKAGGFGINLAEADYVFLLDPWWNPASEAQAVDRAHRIGQEARVMVYRLVADGTIEDKVMALRDRKAALFDEVMSSDDDETGFGGALTADEVRGLLDA